MQRCVWLMWQDLGHAGLRFKTALRPGCCYHVKKIVLGNSCCASCQRSCTRVLGTAGSPETLSLTLRSGRLRSNDHESSVCLPAMIKKCKTSAAASSPDPEPATDQLYGSKYRLHITDCCILLHSHKEVRCVIKDPELPAVRQLCEARAGYCKS